MNWQPFHCFTAAMFFSFQLTANPDQPGAALFRASIRKAMSTLEQSRGIPVADKALDILQALSPLYAADFPSASHEVREKKRQQVLSTTCALACPYHISRQTSDSPSNHGLGSPATVNEQLGVIYRRIANRQGQRIQNWAKFLHPFHAVCEFEGRRLKTEVLKISKPRQLSMLGRSP